MSKKRTKKSPQLSRTALEMVAARFRALGDATRLEILQNLMEGEKTVQELSEITAMSQANISKHLSVLADQGLVTKRREGLYSFYSICDSSVYDLCNLVCTSLENRFARVHEEFVSAANQG